MNILDNQGRLFGKVSILDIGAALIILGVIIGIFVIPGTSGTSIAQSNNNQTVEVDVLVRGLTVGDPDRLYAQFADQKTLSIIIRNQPYDEPVEIKKVERLRKTINVTQPDGSIQVIDDPRPEVTLIEDMRITLASQAEVTNNGVVMSGQKVKIGTVLELDGATYNFRGSVIDVRTEEKS
jgi:hypothetical protein